MEYGNFENVARVTVKDLVEYLLHTIYPRIIQIRCDLASEDANTTASTKLRNLFTLCCSQVKKCFLNLLDVFRLEHTQHICLQESRQSNLERIEWCMKRLSTISKHLSTHSSNQNDTLDDSINSTIMYFANWIDYITLDLLPKLAEVAQRTDYKENVELYETWKNDMLECVTELHVSIDELLLSAMTLYKYCLPSDQLIVKARCQAVLRETKELLGELVEGDLNATIEASVESLKLPIKPSNVSVLIDVLKEALNVLDKNTNTALQALFIHCFSTGMSPVDVLKNHFSEGNKSNCKCLEELGSDDIENCPVVKEFDLYNERLMQIGSFALSYSPENNSSHSLRSGLASLEALDQHLVPNLMISPNSYDSVLLMHSWREEVQVIRDNLFLLFVDILVFIEITKQIMHHKLLDLLKANIYKNSEVCEVINIGGIVCDFFNVYNNCKTEALSEYEKLGPLVADLEKVQAECKIVSNILSSDGDYIYNIKTPKHKDVSNDQLLKRLKLLYTLLSKINSLIQPNSDDCPFYCEDELPNNDSNQPVNNLTTHINFPKRTYNRSKSNFVRTYNIRSSTKNFPLGKLTKHLRSNELSFTVQLENLFDNSITLGQKDEFCVNKNLDRTREQLFLYKCSPIKKRGSLRRALLDRHSKLNSQVLLEDNNTFVSDVTSLQITDVLNEMTDITATFSNTKPMQGKSYGNLKTQWMGSEQKDQDEKNVLTFTVNNANATITKRIWNIPVNASAVEMSSDDTAQNCSASNLTQPSNVTTLERISDLDLVESKLNSLKSQLETSI